MGYATVIFGDEFRPHKKAARLCLSSLAEEFRPDRATFDGSWLLKNAVEDSPVILLIDEKEETITAAITETEGLLVLVGHGWRTDATWGMSNVQLSADNATLRARFIVFDSCYFDPRDNHWAELFEPGTIIKFGFETVDRVSKSRIVMKTQIWQVRAFLERVAQSGVEQGDDVWKDPALLDRIWAEVEADLRKEGKAVHVFQTYIV